MTHFSRHTKLTQLWLIATIILLSGCQIAEVVASSTRRGKLDKKTIKIDPVVDPDIESVSSTKFESIVLKPVQEDSIEDKLFQKILTGDFKAVESKLSEMQIEKNINLQKIKLLLSEYEHIQQLRKDRRKAAYDEQLEEYRKLASDPAPVDVNDISEAFVIITKLYRRCDKEQKKELFEEEYVNHLIGVLKENGEKFQAENKWIEAYSHCYSWLEALHKGNKEYEEINETLAAKIIIENSLSDNSCETGMERHEGIKQSILTKALKILDSHYISVLNYSEMAKKAIARCIVLGEVLANTNEDLGFKVTEEDARLWAGQMQKIRTELMQNELSVITKDKFLWLFEQVLATNEVTLAVPQEIVIAQFSEAALTALDPVTNLVWPWYVEAFQKNMTQDFIGIGVQIYKTRGVLGISSLLPNKPAYFSGLDVDDEILAVDGESTKDMPINCAVSRITGPAGTKVRLTVKHKGAPEGETEDITITRERIAVQTVRGWQRTEAGEWRYMIDPVNKLGYIRITNFTETTEPAVERALKELERDGMKGLILDLRNNSGGYLNTAADIVNKFVKKGVIVTTQPRWALPRYQWASKSGTHPDYPIVLLVNGGSASASEIVAGALKDEKYKRATLVGSRTYGKGSVQEITNRTGSNSQMKFTMAFYHLPSKQPVETRYILEKEGRTDWGIEPDVNIKLKDYEIIKMRDIQSANDVLAKLDHNTTSESVKRYPLGETLESDSQLAMGLIVLKAKVIREGGEIVQIANARAEKKEHANSVDTLKDKATDSKK